MHVRNWGALVCLGLAGVGCGGVEDAATVENSSGEVSAQACPVGVASRLKVVTPPGSDPRSRVHGFTDVQGTLYFVTDPLDGTTTLWKSNGADAGTVPVKVFPAVAVGFPRLTDLVAVGNRLFFQLYEPATGTELWVSDGTTSGTRLVKDITPGTDGSLLSDLTEVNGQLVFFRLVETMPTEPVRVELWRSNGTTAGTVRVRDFGENAGLGRDTLKVGNALLFFFSQDTGTTLWRTDGTAAGTTSIKRLDADLVPIEQVGYAGNLGLFILVDGPNYEVWRTNGTAAGTVRLDSFGKPVSLLGSVGSYVYLSSSDMTTRRLRIDRLSLGGGGKALVTTLPNPYASNDFAIPYVQNTAVSGSQIYFSVAISSPGPAPLDVTLWVTNGTAAGTRDLFRQLSRSDEYISPVVATGAGVVLFSGSPEGGFTEPWFTRGTVATTGQLADIRPGPGGSSPDGFTRVGSRVYFSAIDDTNLTQVWSAPASFTCPPGLAEARE